MLRKILDLISISLVIITVFYLGNSDQLKLLINPRYFVFLFISLIVLFVFFCYILIKPADKCIRPRDISTYLLLLIICLLGVTSSYSGFQSGVSDLKELSLSTVNSRSDNPEGGKRDLLKGDNIEVEEWNYLEVIDGIYRNLDTTIGKKITLTGYVYYPDGAKNREFVLSRLIMVCCAADTSLYGLLCDPGNSYFEKDGWYRVTGVIGKSELNGEIHPIVKITEYSQIDKPEDPYIYPDFF